MTGIVTFFRAMPLRKKILLLTTSILIIVVIVLFFVFENQITTGNDNNNINYDDMNGHNNANNYFNCKLFKNIPIKIKNYFKFNIYISLLLLF